MRSVCSANHLASEAINIGQELASALPRQTDGQPAHPEPGEAFRFVKQLGVIDVTSVVRMAERGQADLRPLESS